MSELTRRKAGREIRHGAREAAGRLQSEHARRRSSGKLFICSRHERRASTPLHDCANLRAEHGNLVSLHARADVLEQQNSWIERQRASEPQADAFGGIELRNRPRPGSLRNPHLRGQASRAYPHVLWRRLDVERKRHRQVLHHGQRVQQHRPVADDAKAIDEASQSALASMADVGRPNTLTSPTIGQRRAGDEVDQHLRGHLVQPQDGSCSPAFSVSASTRSGRRPR